MATPLHGQSSSARGITCPTCRKPTAWQDNPYRPFCSERCRLIDLGCWADEEYRVPSQTAAELFETTENNE